MCKQYFNFILLHDLGGIIESKSEFDYDQK